MKELSRINTKVLGSLIKIHRIQQNMSQKALCEGICVSSYLSKIENAEVVPTQEIITFLFDALGITYDDSEEFLLEGKELIEEYIEKLTFSDFKSINILYHRIMSQGERYIHSPLIIDYYLIQLARYCATPEKGAFQDADKLLKEVVDLMNATQQLLYYLYKGMDLLQLTQDYKLGISYLKKGMTCGEHGHLFYWMAQGYLYENKMLKSLKYTDQALAIYAREVNFNGLMCAYELLSRIYSCLEYEEEPEIYLKKAFKLCKRLDEPGFESYLYYRLAWDALNRGETEKALDYIEKDKDEESLIPKLSQSQVKCFIYHHANLKDKLSQILDEENHFVDEKGDFLMLLFRFYISDIKPKELSALETHLLKGIDLFHKTLEVKYYLQHLLIQYYKDTRRYKEALELYEKTMRK